MINSASWMVRLEQAQTSYLLLATLAGMGLLAALLYLAGIAGRSLRLLGQMVRSAITHGFLLWERSFAWASWQEFLAIVCGIFLLGGLAGGPLPGLRIICGLATLAMGAIACLAYMFIDLERNEVERGHKAVHNPLKGQILARNLERYGKQVGVPLLIAAAVALIGGFAFFNQGLYETIGQHWYQLADARRQPIYADFLAYALTKILGLIDVLDLAKSHHILGAPFIRPAAWPASALLAGFKVFFTFVLLHQIFASLRQGKLLAETIADFWSPHEPIHDRACSALPSLRARGHRTAAGVAAPGHIADQGATGPAAVDPGNDRPVDHPGPGPSSPRPERGRAGDRRRRARPPPRPGDGALVGRARHTTPATWCGKASSRRLGSLAGSQHRLCTTATAVVAARLYWAERIVAVCSGGKSDLCPAPPPDPIELAVATLESALGDPCAAVRTQAALALGRIGPARRGGRSHD